MTPTQAAPAATAAAEGPWRECSSARGSDAYATTAASGTEAADNGCILKPMAPVEAPGAALAATADDGGAAVAPAAPLSIEGLLSGMIAASQFEPASPAPQPPSGTTPAFGPEGAPAGRAQVRGPARRGAEDAALGAGDAVLHHQQPLQGAAAHTSGSMQAENLLAPQLSHQAAPKALHQEKGQGADAATDGTHVAGLRFEDRDRCALVLLL